MKKILLAGSINPLNKGDQARVKATIQALARSNQSIRLALLSHNYDMDCQVYAGDEIEIVKAPWSQSQIKPCKMALIALFSLVMYSILAAARRLLKLRFTSSMLDYDSVVIISGIDFSDFVGRLPLYYCCFIIFLFGVISGTP